MAMTQNHCYFYFLNARRQSQHFEAFPLFNISTADPKVAVSVTIVILGIGITSLGS